MKKNIRVVGLDVHNKLIRIAVTFVLGMAI